MLNDVQTYCIHLEDYTIPRHAAVDRCYYGTMDDMVQFATNLSRNKWAKERYRETIDGINCYNTNSEVSHWVAGSKYPVLTPVNVIFQIDYSLDEQSWNYTGYHHTTVPMCASKVSVSQMLIQETIRYCRCVKVKFEGLICYSPIVGWVCPDCTHNCFPCIVQKTDEDAYITQFYVPEKFYSLEQKEDALKDMHNLVDLDAASKDFMGYI